jgi:hypothetical protein
MRSEQSSHHLASVRLWAAASLLCTCRALSPTRVEIALELNGHTVESRTFEDFDRASQFAIDKMHVYKGQ